MITYSKRNSEESDDTTLPMAPGVYSVLLVGGGGGGCGSPYPDSQNGEQRVSAAGGGSGYAWKGRVTLNEGDVVTIEVGQGGHDGSIAGEDGGTTSLYVNGELIQCAVGGHGAYFSGEARMGSQFTDSLAIGGDGASGGGSSDGDVLRINRLWEMRTPGTGGYDGRDATPILLNGRLLFEGGHGIGEGYYTRLHESCDPDICHLDQYPTLMFGGSAYLVGSQPSIDDLVNRAGGGAGYGTRYLGDVFDDKHTTGHGFGAGGGGGCPGIRGVVSFIRIEE